MAVVLRERPPQHHVHCATGLVVLLLIAMCTMTTFNSSLVTDAVKPYLLRERTVAIDPDPQYSKILSLRSTADSALQPYLTRERMSFDDGWNKYRLGDAFFSSPQQRSTKKDLYALHKRRFPHSIATEVMERHNSTARADYELLLEIVQRRSAEKPELIPANTTLLVHLRLGDVIDEGHYMRVWYNANYTAHDFLFHNISKVHSRQYVFPLSHYAAILARIQQQQMHVERVLIVTGFHAKSYHFNSYDYLNQLMRFIKSKGYNDTSLRLNENPDDDVIIMANSKYFVQAGGGYSRLIAQLVRMKGGVVFN